MKDGLMVEHLMVDEISYVEVVKDIGYFNKMCLNFFCMMFLSFSLFVLLMEKVFLINGKGFRVRKKSVRNWLVMYAPAFLCNIPCFLIQYCRYCDFIN